jgi:asparaginyl-tRNA synthetase
LVPTLSPQDHQPAVSASDVATGVQYRYRSIRTPRAQAILQVQHQLVRACRKFLDQAGFVEVLAPIIGPVTDPGIRGADAMTVSYYGEAYVVMTSAILYKQMAVASLPRIYIVSPNIRLEPPESCQTGRHLAEFYQIDLEVAHGSCALAMDLGDALLYETVRSIRRACRAQLELLGRSLRLPPHHLPRLRYAEALRLLQAQGFELRYGEEIPWQAEQHLSRQFDTPFWITDYPVGSRGFYYLQDRERPDILRSMDLVLPEGYGEVASGGEREHTVARVTQRMIDTGEDPARYRWYLEMLQEGIPASAGFGVGLERLTRYVCGVPHIWECSPFPKVPGIVNHR